MEQINAVLWGISQCKNYIENSISLLNDLAKAIDKSNITNETTCDLIETTYELINKLTGLHPNITRLSSLANIVKAISTENSKNFHERFFIFDEKGDATEVNEETYKKTSS